MSEPGIRIEHYDSERALLLKKPILDVYLASNDEHLHDPWFGPDQFWRRLVELYAPSRGCDLAAAWQQDTMVGFAFGSLKDNPADIWHMVENVQLEMPPAQGASDVFFFREFAVSPEQQGKGYGRLLHDALLGGRKERLAHLLVLRDNRARNMYLHWGWHVVGQVQPFDDSPVMDAMVRTLQGDNASD